MASTTVSISPAPTAVGQVLDRQHPLSFTPKGLPEAPKAALRRRAVWQVKPE
jgi:hypothetical protein